MSHRVRPTCLVLSTDILEQDAHEMTVELLTHRAAVDDRERKACNSRNEPVRKYDPCPYPVRRRETRPTGPVDERGDEA